MSDLTRNVINQMTTNVNLLKGADSVVDTVHDEVVIDVSETVSEKLSGRLFERFNTLTKERQRNET